MFAMPTRWLPGSVAVGLLASGLLAVTMSPARAMNPPDAVVQSGSSEVGNLLDYANTDFEGSIGNWVSDTNATLTDDTTQSFLHDDSLLDTAAARGTSSFQISGAPNPIQIPVTPGAKYRMGAYFETPGTANETVQFSLNCYNSSNQLVGEVAGTANSLLPTTNWQYSEDDVTVPTGCTQVQGSPEVTLGGLPANAAVNMDEVIFAPYRAALIIGAKGENNADGTGGYDAQDWIDTNNKIGPLQSDKEFPQVNAMPQLPTSWNSKKNVCYEIERDIPNPADWPACVINYWTPATKLQVASFFKTTGGAPFPPQQMLIMVWANEPELPAHTFTDEPGCPASDTGAKAFVCEFELQSQHIRAAAADPKIGRTPEVFMAMISATSQYGSGGQGVHCHFIPPTTSTDFYLADHYDENASGKNLPHETSPNGKDWQTWLSCVQSSNKPIGLAEYGLDCTTNPDRPAVADEIKADKKYLEMRTPGAGGPTIIWEYWYSKGQNTPGCVFTNTADITAWQGAETQNGGG